MTIYKALFDEGVLFVKFHGEYVSDEGDRAMLSISRSMSLDEKYAIKKVIWDLKDVTSMTLQNTDGARLARWDRDIIRLLEHPEKDLTAYLKELELFYIEPEDSGVNKIFVERLVRIATPTRQLPRVAGLDVGNLHDLLEALGLLRLEPMLDGEWQIVQVL